MSRAATGRLVSIALAALSLVAIITYAATSPPIITDSDFAVSELYVELATRGELFAGAYSRFGWHHPGPLFYYLIAPVYALAGHQAAALFAVALAVNLSALVVIGWVIARETRGPLLATVTGACLFFAWRVDRFLASPWNAHVAVLPALAFLVIAAAAASGRRRLLPLLAIFGSFAAQTHVGFVPLVLTVGAGVAVVVLRRDASRSWPSLGAAVMIAIALWIMPIVDAMSHAGGNLAALWRFFVVEGRAEHAFREAIIVGSFGLAGVLRRDFELPWGGHFDLNYVFPATFGTIVAAGLLAVIAHTDRAAGRRFESALAVVALAAVVVSVFGLTRVRGDILNHDLFRLSAIGAVALGILAASALRLVFAAAGSRLPGPAAFVASVLVVAIASAFVGVRHLDSFTAYERRQRRSQIVEAHRAIRDYLRAQRVERPLLRTGPERWADTAGVLLRLRQDGTAVAVPDDNRPMFTDVFAATGHEDAIITFADLDLHRELRVKPDNVILLQAFPLFVDAMRTPAAAR